MRKSRVLRRRTELCKCPQKGTSKSEATFITESVFIFFYFNATSPPAEGSLSLTSQMKCQKALLETRGTQAVKGPPDNSRNDRNMRQTDTRSDDWDEIVLWAALHLYVCIQSVFIILCCSSIFSSISVLYCNAK